MDPRGASTSQAQVEAFGRRHRTGLVTLVFTDMVGSTALKQQLGDRAGAQVIEQHHALVRATLQEFPDGEELSTAGDSFFLVFTTPSAGVKFALILQQRLRELSRQAPVPVQDRLGLHLGEVLIQEADQQRMKDLIGLNVDLGARVMGLAQGGQILLTRAVFDSARQALKGEDIAGVGQLNWLNHGLYQLKGIEEAVEICEVGEVGAGPLRCPATTEKGRRVEAAEGEAVLGWRPAVGQAVPNTQWVLEKKLGEGGFGEVWLGRHQAMKERRVFKFCFRADRVRSLKREMTLFRLIKERIGDHPNIVRLLGVYFDHPPYYVEMDYVEGQDLRAWCEAQGGAEKVPLEVKLEIVAQIADALQAAHDAGVIHRDVKPANILVSRWGETPSSRDLTESPKGMSGLDGVSPYRVQAKLTDFGIGQVVSEEYLSGVTKAGFTQTILADSSSSKTGTQLYMAPELLAGKPASTRSDIYSLGVVLYQLLVGDFTRPVATDWGKEITDPLLREDLQHCFAGKPEDRFGAAVQLAGNLRAFDQRKAELALRERLQRREKQRHKIALLSGAVAAVLLLVAAALGYGLHRTTQERDRQALFAYASDMRAAHAAIQENNLGQAKDLLLRHVPGAGQRDLRGVEWRYLWLKCRSDDTSTFRHRSHVEAADISPDGRWVATQCAGEVLVWDASTRQPVKRFQGVQGVPPKGLRSHLAFCPTGQYFAAQSPGGLTLWDTSAWVNLTTLPGTNTQPVFSGDGRVLAAVCEGRIRVWETGTWKPLLTAREAKDAGRADLGLAINYDGSVLAFASEAPPEITVWDLRKHSLCLRVALPEVSALPGFSAVALSPDNRWLAAGTWWSGHLYTWDLQDGHLAAKCPAHPFLLAGLAFAPDGKTLVSGGNDQLLRFWEPGTTNLLSTLKGHESEIWNARFSGDGRWLVSASKDMSARVWAANAIASAHPAFRLPADHLIGELSPEGGTISTVNVKAWALEEWDTTTSRMVKQVMITPTNQFQRLNYRLYPWMYLTDPEAYETRKYGPELLSLTVARGPWGLAAGTCDGRILAWDRQTGGLVFSNKVGQGSISPQLLPPFRDGNHLQFLEATGPGHFALVWWNLSENRPELIVRDLVELPFLPAVSQDGVWMCFPSGTQSITVRNLRTGHSRTILTGHTMKVTCAAFSPDGRLVATGSDDAMVQLWETKSGRPFGPVLRGHLSGIVRIEFSSNGRTLLTYADIIHARVWNVATGQQMLAPLPASGLTMNHILHGVFSGDDRFLVEPEGDDQVRFIRLPTFAEIEAAEKAGVTAPQR